MVRDETKDAKSPRQRFGCRCCRAIDAFVGNQGAEKLIFSGTAPTKGSSHWLERIATLPTRRRCAASKRNFRSAPSQDDGSGPGVTVSL